MEVYTVKVDSVGDIRWYQNDKVHRYDGPAIEYANGDKAWYKEGNLHRTDGPAVEYADGDKVWCQNNRRHRTDGPAVVCANGSKEWWIKGKRLSEEEFLAKTGQQSCEGKIVEVDGKKYRLVEA